MIVMVALNAGVRMRSLHCGGVRKKRFARGLKPRLANLKRDRCCA